MTAESTRTLKEARALLVPWCAVMIVCTLPFLQHLYNPGNSHVTPGPDEFLNLWFEIGVLIGIPLLACLSFGNEFRHKTMELLMSQPVHRLKIWREKWSVTAFAVLAATLLASLSSQVSLSVTRPADAAFLIFLVVTTCSAPFWTLLSRSTLGGLVLSIAAFIPFLSVISDLWDWNTASGHVSRMSAIFIFAAATLGYSAVMLWLGRWMLVGSQSGGGLAGPDLMAALPHVMPARIAALFRCHPNQVVLNLIRKELRLLRPVWLLSALYVVGWIAMAFSFSFVSEASDWHHTALIALVMVSATYPVIAIFLAASVPLGEERAFGIQMWHLALPISMKTQWLVRLLAGLLAAGLCAVAIPAALTAMSEQFLRPLFVSELARMSMLLPVSALLSLFLFAFWCSVLARDLTRSAVMVAGAGGLIFLAVEGGTLITEWFTGLFGHVLMYVVSWYQLNPYTLNGLLSRLPSHRHTPEWLFDAVLITVMTLHTYPLFRRLPEQSTIKILRPLVPYLVGIFVIVSFSTFRSWGAWETPFELFYNIESAVVKLQPTNTLTVEDLLNESFLSVPAQRWLRNSTMTVSVTDPDRARGNRWILPHGRWKVYNLSFHLPTGTTCAASFPFVEGESHMFWFAEPHCN